MSRKIKFFKDKSYLEFDKGRFDNWCVYICNDNQKFAPKDTDYLHSLREFSNKYGVNKVYSDFVTIYNLTNNSIEESTLNAIERIAHSYNFEDQLNIEKLFTILYMTMVAEENYKNTKLGRKIKRLAVYETLINNNDVYYSANFMRGMDWRKIEKLCEERGF